MKKLLLSLACASCALAQWAAPPTSGYAALNTFLDSLTAVQLFAGTPSGACTEGHDFAVDTINTILYACGANGWFAAPSLISGSGSPSNSLGANGSFYLRIDTTALYGPKATGAWPGSGVSLIGATGATGAVGSAATITAGTATGLSSGASPTVSNSGSSSAAVFNFGIPAGAVGAAGPTGAAATITAGTAAGLSSGASPTVTNSGSSSAAIFNFGIPAGPGYTATSTTSLILTNGSQSITTQAGLAYSAGARVRITNSSITADYMEGLVTSYSGTSLVVNIDTVGGSGTFTSWNINLAGNVGSLSATGQDMWFIGNTSQMGTPGTGWALPPINYATPFTATGTTNQYYATLHFSSGVTQYAYFKHVLPTNWNGTIDFVYRWRTGDSNTGHNEVLNVAGVCIPASGSTGDPAFGTANVSTVAANSTAYQQVVTTLSALANLTSCGSLTGSGNVLSFQVSQTGGLSNDFEIIDAFFRPSCGTALCTY